MTARRVTVSVAVNSAPPSAMTTGCVCSLANPVRLPHSAIVPVHNNALLDPSGDSESLSANAPITFKPPTISSPNDIPGSHQVQYVGHLKSL